MNAQPVLDLIQDGRAAVTIITAPDGSHDEAANRVAAAIKDQFGIEPAILAATQSLTELPTPHVIALGCLADNPYIEYLYYGWHTLVDRWYPGDGGWVIQTLFSPQRPGNHVVLLGGTHASGVDSAADQFITSLKTYSGSQIPWSFEVQLGDSHLPLPEDRIDALGTSPSEIEIPESALPEKPYASAFKGGSPQNHLLRLGMYGPHADNYHICRSSEFGLRYLYSGLAADADRYRETLLSEVRSGVLQKLYHYKSLRMFQLWSIFGLSSVFTAEESVEITAAIQRYLIEESGIANRKEISADGKDWNIFNRHTACDALNMWIGTDWLWRLTDDNEWLKKRAEADAYFESQAGVDVPLTGLTEGYASYLEVYLEWMLLSRPNQIESNRHISLWAERVMALCTNTGELVLGPQTDVFRYPYNLLRKLAHILNDGRYLFVADLREKRVLAGMDRLLQFSAGQAYAGDNAPREPESGQLIITPMNERLRRWIAPTITENQGFDRAVARSGWTQDDDYLMLIGVRGAAKSLPNVGALAAYERFGQRLITSDSVPLYPASASPWRHSTICVNIGGLGPGMFSGAEVLTDREVADGHLFSFQMNSPRMCRWVRTLFWKTSAYVLIIDQVELETDEDFTVGVNWRCGGQVSSIRENLATLDFDSEVRFHIQTDTGVELTVETNHYPVLGLSEDTEPNSETILHSIVPYSGNDRTVKTATLLHATKDAQGPSYQLESSQDGWIVSGSDEALGFQLGSKAGELEIEPRHPTNEPIDWLARGDQVSTPRVPQNASLTTRWSASLSAEVTTWTQPADSSSLAVGLADGSSLLLDPNGQPIWQTRSDSKITAMTFHDEDLIIGSHSGQVSRFDPEGKIKWQHQCRFRSERTFWPWWFLPTPKVAAIAARNDVIVAGTGSTNLNFLDAKTGELLHDVISPYGLPDRIRTHRTENGDLQFLLGHAYLTCSSTVRAWSSQAQEEMRFEKSLTPMGRSMDGWDTCGVVDFQISPLEQNQPKRLIVLRHGAVNQLTAYDLATSEPLWDATLSSSPVALVVMPVDLAEQARCYVADQFGGIAAFNPQGNRISSIRLDTTLQGMEAGPNGTLVAWSSSMLHIIKDSRHIDSHSITGITLGLIEIESGLGFLSSDSSKLHFQDIT